MFEFIICAVLLIGLLYFVYKRLENYYENIQKEKNGRLELIARAETDREERKQTYENARKKRLGTKDAIDKFLDTPF